MRVFSPHPFSYGMTQRLRFRPRDRDEDAAATEAGVATSLDDEALNDIGDDIDGDQSEDEEEVAAAAPPLRQKISQSTTTAVPELSHVDQNRFSFAPEAGRGAPLAELALGKKKCSFFYLPIRFAKQNLNL